ncbi:MAG TPA: GTP pyrophosphokinase family protein, partial [Candidatus Avimonoglobus intestinipullorum]|nr:GTP pyrophosphokinase family protein [Candidatus Avimonoglobus intestinipullorum]
MRIENMNTREYRVAMVLYSSALKIVTAKLDIINEELHLRKKNTPIEYIKSRLKTADSISAKLVRRGYAPTLTNAKKYIDDIAGVRIICAFTDDIYEVAQIIEQNMGFDVVLVKDYIKNPKP